jgi:hypothetical protein
VLSPASQVVRGNGRILAGLTLANEGKHGFARDLVLKVTVAGGQEYLTSLQLIVPAAATDAAAKEFRLPDLAPGSTLSLQLQASVAWTAPATSNALARPSIDLRVEVVARGCMLAAIQVAPAAARILIEPPNLQPVPVKPITALDSESTLDSPR